MSPSGADARTIVVSFQSGWEGSEAKGLLGDDQRLKLLRKVLVSYPEVRHILPNRISLDPEVDLRFLEPLARFLERQQWLIKTVEMR